MADLDDIKEGKDFGIDRPQQNTLYTLKGCGSLDWGMQSRLARIFNPHSNRTVMLAFDHGYFQGPTTGLERIDLSIAPLFADTDVLMCTRGVLRSQVPAATNKPVVLRLRRQFDFERTLQRMRGGGDGRRAASQRLRGGGAGLYRQRIRTSVDQ
jgi:hypothetical protein